MHSLWAVTRRRSVARTLERLDATIADAMERWGHPILRLTVAVVFIWFGLMKVAGVGPITDFVAATIYLVPPELFVPLLGVWEVTIGLCLLYRPLIRLGVALLFLQLPGTFLPMIVLPAVVYETFPHVLTIEGQYIVKNLVIIGAAIVIGGTVRDE